MASISSVFLLIVIVTIKLHHAESQTSVLATNQVQIIKFLEEITSTSTPLVPNITALLTNQEVLLENSTAVLNEMKSGQGEMLKRMDEITTTTANHETLLQNTTSVLNEMKSGQVHLIKFAENHENLLQNSTSVLNEISNGQVQMIKVMEETATSTANHETLLQNSTAVLNEMKSGQTQMIKRMDEMATSTANHETLLQNSTAVLNEMNSAIHQIAAAQIHMAESLNQIAFLLQRVHIPPTDCSHVSEFYNHGSRVYTIDPKDDQESFDVYCDMDTDDGGWTVFQKRFNGSVDFFLDWTDYENGFGNLQGEHWLGLQQMHRLTSSGRWTLRIDLEDFDGNIRYAQYEDFKIGDAASFYKLSLGSFSGNTSDSLTYHNGFAFTTKDQDHDGYNENCALVFQAAGWYGACYSSNLNGIYQGSSRVPNSPGGSLMCWNDFIGMGRCIPLKRSEMKMRKVQ